MTNMCDGQTSKEFGDPYTIEDVGKVIGIEWLKDALVKI